MKTNRDKNIEHNQRQASQIRPKSTSYNFTELERVMNLWVRGEVRKQDEIYSPFLGAL
jgi:hypothetical protein